MQVSSPTLARLEHLNGQLDRTAYLLDDAAATLTAVDFRTRSWSRAAQAAIETTQQAWDAVKELQGWSKSDASEIDDFASRKVAVAHINKADATATRNMTGAMDLSKVFDHGMDRTTARYMIDTMARLATVSGSAIRDAAGGMLALTK